MLNLVARVLFVLLAWNSRNPETISPSHLVILMRDWFNKSSSRLQEGTSTVCRDTPEGDIKGVESTAKTTGISAT